MCSGDNDDAGKIGPLHIPLTVLKVTEQEIEVIGGQRLCFKKYFAVHSVQVTEMKLAGYHEAEG